MLMGIQEMDELIDDWTPEPLVAAPTVFEELENEKRPVIIGYVRFATHEEKGMLIVVDLQGRNPSSRTGEQSQISHPTTSITSSQTRRSRKRLSKHSGHTASVPVDLQASMEHRTCT